MKIKHFFIILALFLSGCSGCNEQDLYSACDCEQKIYTEQYAIASPTFTSGSWSTFEHAGGEFTADATCHTNMEVSFFWLDSARDASNEIPPIIPSFETPTGYFPPSSEPSRSDITVNGSQVWAWQYRVNQAADKNDPSATSYKVGWTYDTNYSPPGEVYVLISIGYSVFDANEHTRDVEEPCD